MDEIELIKSENDSMEYRLVTLPNGLRALLVSDVKNIKRTNPNQKNLTRRNTLTRKESMDLPGCKENEKLGSISKSTANKEKMGACSLSINVGSFSDPPDVQGMAHFLEHMVFMGSEKYPEENAFNEFVQKHGGFSNAFTSYDTTCFYFECNEENLNEGIDRFAQFFISPLMKKEAMTREREAVNSEFELSLTVDDARQTQVLSTFAPDNHPARKFSCGNLKTLKDNIDDDYLYEKVHEFRKRHYSAHRMTVAVQACFPLDVLERFVRESFSDVSNNDLPPDDFDQETETFGGENFHKIIWLKPVYDICQLELSWILPPYVNEYKSLPFYTAEWLIGYRGKGGLMSFLQQKVWAFSCNAGGVCNGSFQYNTLYSIFFVAISLTEEGYDHMDEVITAVFSFIETIKQNWPNDRIMDELEQINLTDFRFKDETSPVENVKSLSTSMHLYEPEHVIAGGDIYLERKPEVVAKILEALTPDKVNVTIYTNKKPEDFYDRTEEWFGSKYRIEDIPEEWTTKWNECSMQNLFHIPDPNPYIVDDFSLLDPPEENLSYPEKLQDDELIELWYKQDTKFARPTGMYCFYIKSPITNTTPLNAAFLNVLNAFLEFKLVEPLYPAALAGFSVSLTPTRFGLMFKLNGYSQKLPIFFHEILRLVRDFIENLENEENEELFKAVMIKLSENCHNALLDPDMLLKQLVMSIQIKEFWTFAELCPEFKKISLENLHEFAVQYFSNVKISALVQGNISQDEAINICQQFSEILNCAPLTTPMPPEQEAKMNPGEIYLRVKSFNKDDHNSVILNYYEDGPANIRKTCIVEILLMLMEAPLFDSLRNKQQLGYEVSCCSMKLYRGSSFGIKVIFQAQKFGPDDVDSRIESFLSEFSETLKSMTEGEIEEIKTALIEVKNNADLTLSDEVERNFEEICEDKYVFDRIQKEVATIPGITKEELCEWLDEHIAGGRGFKKLSIQVINNVNENDGEEEEQEEQEEQEQEQEQEQEEEQEEEKEEEEEDATKEDFFENFSIQDNLIVGDDNSGKIFIRNLEEFKNKLEFYTFSTQEINLE